ncbi:hypothetical protein V8D89_001710 [Ganoderma adspersum]
MLLPQDVEEDEYQSKIEELQGHVCEFPGNIASFLSVMVPSRAPDVPNPVSQRAFTKYRPLRGKRVKSYACLLSGLRAVVSTFPDDKRPKFFPLHRKELPFGPFPTSTFSRSGHYKTTPDLAVSFPGDPSVTFDWQNTACFIQVKGNRADDPFEQNSGLAGTYGATVAQLAIGARALMAVHGHSAVFALGIYATRIPPAASYASTLPAPSPRLPTGTEQNWFVDSLRAAGHTAPASPTLCRRVECEGICGDATVSKAYFTIGFIDVSPRLMSQATVVWRAIEDPRWAAHSSLSALPEVDGNITVVVVKDSWRQMRHRSDPHVFERLWKRKIPESKCTSSPVCVVACDLGDIAVRRWVAVSPYELPATIDVIREHLEDECEAEESASPGFPVSATMPIEPPPLPLHQTWTSHLVQGPEGVYNERSHVRSVTSTVGRPLTEFKDTRQLCQAVRDAIAAHKTLWDHGRILHRDINPRNILIVDADLCQSQSVGVLHDFHHISMVSGGVGRLASFERDRDDDSDYVRSFQRFDTRYFLATELLESPDGRHEVDHDLESFFWVLPWVVLRHTRHTFSVPDEQLGYTALFGADPATIDVDVDVDAEFGTRKRDYLLGFINVITWNNGPLEGLLREFRLRCGRSIDEPVASRIEMNHDEVLHIFDRALARDGSEVESGPRSDLKKRKRDAPVSVKGPQAEAGARPRKRAKARRQ